LTLNFGLFVYSTGGYVLIIDVKGRFVIAVVCCVTYKYSGGRCVNEDGSNGCLRRSQSYVDSDHSVHGQNAPQASRPIWLDELTCSGDEQELGECRRAGWGVTDCGHKEDAGCVCTPRPTISPVRGLCSRSARILTK